MHTRDPVHMCTAFVVFGMSLHTHIIMGTDLGTDTHMVKKKKINKSHTQRERG